MVFFFVWDLHALLNVVLFADFGRVRNCYAQFRVTIHLLNKTGEQPLNKFNDFRITGLGDSSSKLKKIDFSWADLARPRSTRKRSSCEDYAT